MKREKFKTVIIFIISSIFFYLFVFIGMYFLEISIPKQWHEFSEQLFLILATIPMILFASTQYLRLKEEASLVRGTTQIQEMVVREASLTEVLNGLARLVEMHVEGMLCSFYISESEGQRLIYGAAPSFPKDYIDKLGEIPIGPNEGSCGTAAYRKEGVIVSDIQTDPLWDKYREIALPAGFRACWSMPILSNCESVVGTFALYYHRPKMPTPKQIKLLERFTSLAGIIIEHYLRGDKLRLFNQSTISPTMEKELGGALRDHEFELHYQPRLDILSGRIASMEALIRWNHPEKGQIAPDQFIPVAEETGLIVTMGKWVLYTACEQVKAWHQKGYHGLGVSVNISTKQLQSSDFLATVSNALFRTRLDGRYLELEITESSLMEDVRSVAFTLKKLKDMGIKIAVDDFGTGYSSLKYLQHLPVDALKIDKSFMQAITNDSGKAIPRSIIQLAQAMQMEVVAEGVETKEQETFCYENKCNQIQGYYLSRPLPHGEVPAFIDQWRSKRLLPFEFVSR
jgi:EAL domain-containing protein (putative c-di-GMP-specific phosphodiesterase class I)